MSESVEKSFAKIRELTVEGLEAIIEERLVEVLSLIDRLVQVQTEEEEKALLQQSGCTCEKCQELRAKYNIAPPVPGPTQVH